MPPRKIPISLHCGLNLVREVVGGKWKISLLYLISQGVRRPYQLQQKLPGAARRVLYAQLRELEAHELVTRTIFAELPPRVEYHLTAFGESFLPLIAALGEWGETHKAQLHRVLGLVPESAPAVT
ncbi:HxlR family transcriptional regulator [Hymenobacter psoromatis]|nr:HxlR family transcriptional regulator [Hymenobacter psoromatis]